MSHAKRMLADRPEKVTRFLERNLHLTIGKPKNQIPKTSTTLQDGVYVDVSCRNNYMILGFALLKDKQFSYVSCSSENQRDTFKAEMEAVLKAQAYWPKYSVYCDEKDVCSMTGAVYINRSQNPAHKCAYKRINFKAWATT